MNYRTKLNEDHIMPIVWVVPKKWGKGNCVGQANKPTAILLGIKLKGFKNMLMADASVLILPFMELLVLHVVLDDHFTSDQLSIYQDYFLILNITSLTIVRSRLGWISKIHVYQNAKRYKGYRSYYVWQKYA